MSALIIVDYQYDFLEDGKLAVKGGSEILPIINELVREYKWECICATQDFHPQDHISFASNHKGREPFDEIDYTFDLTGEVQKQRLWPDHCVQGTPGADLHKDLDVQHVKVFKKGYNSKLDSYSGFADSFNHESTGLDEHLKEHRVKSIYLVGLAEDYCVLQTALAAAKRGYHTFIIRDAVRGIEALSDVQLKELQALGIVHISVSSNDLQSLQISTTVDRAP